MKKYNSLLVSILAVALLMISSVALAGDDEEEYFIQHALNKYFDLPQNARSIGMAGADVPSKADASSVFGNPAGLGWLEKPEVSLSYKYDQISGDDFPALDSIDEDIHNGYIQAAIPFSGGEYGVLGLGLSLYTSDVDDMIDTDTDGWRLHLAYAKTLSEYWSLGGSLTYYNDEEDNDFVNYEMDDGFRLKLGTQVRPNEDVTIGFSGFYGWGDPESDFKLALIDDNSADRWSWGLELGLGWQAAEKTFLAFALDYTSYDLNADIEGVIPGTDQDVDEDGDAFGIHIGIEQGTWWEWLDARAGYRYRNVDYDFDEPLITDFLSGDADMHALSGGLGVSFNENVSLDYGVEYRWIGDGDWTHAVTLNFRF